MYKHYLLLNKEYVVWKRFYIKVKVSKLKILICFKKSPKKIEIFIITIREYSYFRVLNTSNLRVRY